VPLASFPLGYLQIKVDDQRAVRRIFASSL
jgi:hypothetical protein